MKSKKYTCPCCGYLTLDSKEFFEVCPVCYWEDDVSTDSLDEESPANGMTLRQGRKNFTELGACDPAMLPYVRKPRKKEMLIEKNDKGDQGREYEAKR